jgi:uncharacterized protein (DUF58 family)
VLGLPNDLVVSPRLGPAAHFRDDDAGHDGPTPASETFGEPRGVRPYRPGDSRRFVHWPATAHAGRLMVREMDAPTWAPVTVTVILPPDADAAERVAESALGTVCSLLDDGIPVVLATTERGGPAAGPVADRRQAGRRLALAVCADGRRPASGDGVSVGPGGST